jgi:hypothetical protein
MAKHPQTWLAHLMKRYLWFLLCLNSIVIWNSILLHGFIECVFTVFGGILFSVSEQVPCSHRSHSAVTRRGTHPLFPSKLTRRKK